MHTVHTEWIFLLWFISFVRHANFICPFFLHLWHGYLFKSAVIWLMYIYNIVHLTLVCRLLALVCSYLLDVLLIHASFLATPLHLLLQSRRLLVFEWLFPMLVLALITISFVFVPLLIHKLVYPLMCHLSRGKLQYSDNFRICATYSFIDSFFLLISLVKTNFFSND